ncbi:MAG: hypothetical protein NC485_09985 [Ruminococcus flavefaciens]|nr:hypothetical protein [Ruminococcus flavefaciens]MCM1061993.1 hypothetical protein [Eubacterium sp.]
MPNHITNIVYFSGDERRIQSMLNEIQNDEYGVGSVDFNKIIPMPEENYGFTAKRTKNVVCYENNQRDWAVANWGTKWNSYGYTSDMEFKDGKLAFLTAWTAPHPILQRLSEIYPEIEITHEWADEDIGMNCGKHVYFDGEIVGEYFPASSRERIEFAARVMDSDPADWGLFLNASGTDYVNFSDEEFEIVEIEGKTALFTNKRMTDADIPKGLHCYHLKHSDDGNFCTLEKSAAVNHAGSVIVKEPIELGENGCISLNSGNAPNFTGETTLMENFFTNEEEQSEFMGMEVT